MDDLNNIKKIIKEKYAEIAVKSEQKSSCGCCGSSNEVEFSVFSDQYDNLQGYVPEADLNLGCGLPTEYAGIKQGDTVVDLGSGAGNDVFVARSLVGETGKVIGIDMTEEMLAKANKNNGKLGYSNVEFKFGEIEEIPLDNNSINVVISNCVLNLVPDKKKAFSEIFRILKPGGHFCVSDVVLKGDLPPALQKSAEMYAGCVAGALQQKDYLKAIENSGFTKIEIKKSKAIDIPDDILLRLLSINELREFHASGTGIFSITVVGYKV